MIEEERSEQAQEEAQPDAEEAQPDAAEAKATAAPPVPPEPEEQLAPKERRARERSRHTGEARPQRGPEERARERSERRRQKAASRRTWRARQRQKRATQGPAGPATTAPVDRGQGGRARERHGVVVSDRADKTISVRIDVTRRHRTYKKIIRSSSTLHAHDEQNEAHAGDSVRVVESRPLSRTKRWRLVEVTSRAR